MSEERRAGEEEISEEELAEVEALFARARAESDPGPRFFASMREEIEDQLAPRDALPGGLLEEGRAASGGWWCRVRALFEARPSLSWGAVMGAGLVLVSVWASQGPPRVEAPLEAPVAGGVRLEEAEVVRLRALAEGLEIDLLGEEGGWGDLGSVDVAEVGFGEVLEGLSDEDLELLEGAWDRAL